MNTAPTRVQRVDPSELRRICQDSGLLRQSQHAQLAEEVKRSRHVDHHAIHGTRA